MSPAADRNISDDQLVAYIDGELGAAEQESLDKALSEDAAVRERLEHLRAGGRPFGEAFDLLLAAAPDDKLQAMFAKLVEKEGIAATEAGDGEKIVPLPVRGRRDGNGTPFWQLAAAAAILALVFTGGLLAGGFFEPQAPTQVAEQKPGWREAAARYVALFSKETLEGMPAEPEARQENLQRAAAALGLDLSEERIANAELDFHGTQLLQLDGVPLTQISYLYDGTTPVALCIIKTANPSAAPAEEKRHGLNIVHWVEGGYGFMVIGKVPEDELQQISASFREKFS